MSDRNFACYEAAKHEWEQSHPGATPAEHECAMQAIARRFGI